jgi:hypothetical protein
MMTETDPIPDAPSAPASTAATGAPTPDLSTTGPSHPPPGKLQSHDTCLPVVCRVKQELNSPFTVLYVVA